MSADKPRHYADLALSDEALNWLVRLNSGYATDADGAAFTAWRTQSAEHDLAAREAEAIWQGIGTAGDEARQLGKKEARARLTRRGVLGIGALAVTGVTLAKTGVIGPRLFADYTTGVGEQRHVSLPDGSVAFLNAGSALSINFNDRERSLELFEGQATFTVMREASRPFIVTANNGRTRAIGTVFDIDVRRTDVAVTVLEGLVSTFTDNSLAPAVVVKANQRVRYAARGIPSAVETINADAETAWRRGKLIFNRRPLGDVVSDIERYRRGQIVIVGDKLRSLEVTGVFDLADPDALLRTIKETLPVRMTKLPFVTVVY